MNSPPPRLTLATGNPHKVAEIRALLFGTDVQVRHLGELDDPPELSEPHETFSENALAKALTVAQATGEPALADDSGLMVDALDGAPGVISARYAGENATGEQLVAKLLREMAGVPEELRTARFVCALSLASPQGEVGQWTGIVEGLITTEPIGDGGFGYDPVFYYPPARITFAQMTPTNKNAVSHRGRALRAFAEEWGR